MKESGSYIQCLNCGHVYVAERKVSIEVSVINSECPKCEYHRGLNCGDRKEDIYLYYDPVLDSRWYD